MSCYIAVFLKNLDFCLLKCDIQNDSGFLSITTFVLITSRFSLIFILVKGQLFLNITMFLAMFSNIFLVHFFKLSLISEFDFFANHFILTTFSLLYSRHLPFSLTYFWCSDFLLFLWDNEYFFFLVGYDFVLRHFDFILATFFYNFFFKWWLLDKFQISFFIFFSPQ